MRVLSITHMRENIRRLSSHILNCETVSDDDLKSNYAKSIEWLRKIPCCSENIEIHFQDSDLANLAIAQGVFAEASLENAQTEDSKIASKKLYAESVQLIKNTSPELYELFNLITTDIVFVNSTRVGGGTGSHLPGVICVSIGDGWKSIDLAQCLIHEATYLTTFLSDMVFRLYTELSSQLDRDECRVLSAVKAGERRPLDKALHSGLVAVPLMYFENLNKVPRSKLTGYWC